MKNQIVENQMMKLCSKCGIVKKKTNCYFRNTNQKYRSECIQCCCIKQKEWRDKKYEKKTKIIKKQIYGNNREKIRNQQKKYYDENRDVITKNKINYEKNRNNTDIKYRLIKNTRRRIHHALKGKTKSSSTKEILGIVIDLYKKWIEYQMTPQMHWINIGIDQVKPIYLFDVSKDEELKEAFSWKNTQPLLKQEHQHKGTKYNFLDYQLQFVKAYQFIKLNEQEGLSQDFYWWHTQYSTQEKLWNQ